MSHNKTTRRAFLRLVGAASGAAVLAACGATPTPTPLPKPTATPVPASPTKPPAPALEKNVTVYSVNGPEIVEPVLAPFIKKYPDLKVDIVYLPSTGEGINRLNA